MEIEGFRVLRGDTNVEDKNVETQKGKKKGYLQGPAGVERTVNFRRRGK
jgi:hypothetical protein